MTAGQTYEVVYATPLQIFPGIHNATATVSNVNGGIDGDATDFVSLESKTDYENKLNEVCENLTLDLNNWPSIKFGVETALLDLENGGTGNYFNNAFTSGQKQIPINGLVWMGDPQFMQDQIEEKIEAGFSTIKMKIGAIDFNSEIRLLQGIRSKYSPEQITLRVDANGAFIPKEALNKLERLSELAIHSIEQPIKAGQWKEMSTLCSSTQLPIALDEELIGINLLSEKLDLIQTIQPHYIILKPSLHGGLSGTREWIEIAESNNIPWWITSALESNIGLKAICQFTAEFENHLPQGLGTGSLYTDNVESDLLVERGCISLKEIYNK
ncbi:o-succinylbenzoate synthase [Crocinitomicaceae bacterium]|nr:o-succinylbenzoate synthase [Crocinitomicaceae bacterium]